MNIITQCISLVNALSFRRKFARDIMLYLYRYTLYFKIESTLKGRVLGEGGSILYNNLSSQIFQFLSLCVNLHIQFKVKKEST